MQEYVDKMLSHERNGTRWEDDPYFREFNQDEIQYGDIAVEVEKLWPYVTGGKMEVEEEEEEEWNGFSDDDIEMDGIHGPLTYRGKEGGDGTISDYN